MFFNGPDNYQKLPLHVGDLDPHLIMVSWANLSHPQMASRDSFCTAHECDQQTHTRRDHATPSVTIDRIILCYACDATQKQRKKPCSGILCIGPSRPPVLSDQNQILHKGRFSGMFRSFKVSSLSHYFRRWIRA